MTVELPDLNIARVVHRVGRGGHDVPPERVLARRDASIRNFPEFARRADAGLLVDNALTDRGSHVPRPRIAAEKREGSPWRVTDATVAPYLTHWLSMRG